MANLINIHATDVSAIALLQGVTEKLAPRETTRLMRRIASMLERNAQKRFDMKVDPDGTAWKPWSETTRMLREDEGRGTLMEYSGHMRDSIQKVSGPTEAVLSVLAPYAIYHDSINNRSSNLPRRGILTGSGGTIGAMDRAGIDKLLKEYLNA